MDTPDNTPAHCAQLHTNDRNRAAAYADRMLSLGYRVTTSSDYSPTKRGTVYTVTVARTGESAALAANTRAVLERDRSSGNTGATN